jgi:hypothetical protein
MTVRCGNLKQVCNVVKKWVGDRQKVGVVGRTNNQALALGSTHEWKRACMIFKKMSIRSNVNSYSCR